MRMDSIIEALSGPNNPDVPFQLSGGILLGDDDGFLMLKLRHIIGGAVIEVIVADQDQVAFGTPGNAERVDVDHLLCIDPE